MENNYAEKKESAATYDRKIKIATAGSSRAAEWKNQSVCWSDFVKKLEDPIRTPETCAEYASMSKEQRGKVKDVGGYVGGSLRDGKRRKDCVEVRSIVTLDADYADQYLLDDLHMIADCSWAAYSTHSSTQDHPRYRLLIPLDRDVTPEEYVAIARKVAEQVGIDYMDHTSYDVNRLMYWPSCSADAEYTYDHADLPLLSADDVLAQYKDWHDVIEWPRGKAEEKIAAIGSKQADPLKKPGLVGAYCRAYFPIQSVLEGPLAGVYTPTDDPNRWTYADGTTTGGLIVYSDRYVYSHHSTDPASGILCNAFDLVRIHMYGNLDKGVSPAGDAGVTSLPSYKAMEKYCLTDDRVKLQRIADKRAEKSGSEEGKGEEKTQEPDMVWMKDLEQTKQGIKPSLNNLRLIMSRDKIFEGVRYNAFADQLTITGGTVPWAHGPEWTDADDAHLEVYLAGRYTEFPSAKVQTALTDAATRRAYHPVKEYLESLPEWDGVPRVESLLIEHLGAEDCSYVRAVTRKVLCAAIRRIYHPGTKFDTVLVMIGGQGIGKSTILSKLGGAWFTDALKLSAIKDKTAAEQIQGKWIVELGELQGMRKADINALKGFFSAQTDRYRAAYGRRAHDHPRQCIFVGTTNEQDGFLRDPTGGRRFWPVHVRATGEHPYKMTQAEVDQIWAEALTLEPTESLDLDPADKATAMRMQQAEVEFDPCEGRIRAYLDMHLPDDWAAYDLERRAEYIRAHLDDDILQDYAKGDADDDFVGLEDTERTHRREVVCLPEIWSEALGLPLSRMSRADSNALKLILARIPGWEASGRKGKRFPIYGVQKYWERVTSV